MILELTLSSTEKITNNSFLTDNSESTCASLRQNNNNNNNNNNNKGPPVLHLVHEYRFDDIKLQIIFNQSASCSKMQIFYIDSPHLRSETCTSKLARKCRVLNTKVTDDRQCNYECPCPGKVTCDIMIFNHNDLDTQDLEICDVFAYKTWFLSANQSKCNICVQLCKKFDENNVLRTLSLILLWSKLA